MSPRIAPAPRTGHREDVQKALDAAIGSTGAQNVFRTIARNPGLYLRYGAFAGKLFSGGKLSVRDRELVILRVAWLCDSEYEWAQHARIGREIGLDEFQLADIRVGSTAPSWNEWDGAVLRATEELVLEHTVSKESWDALRRGYEDEQMIEFLFLAGSYVMLAGFLNAAEVEIEPGYSGW